MYAGDAGAKPMLPTAKARRLSCSQGVCNAHARTVKVKRNLPRPGDAVVLEAGRVLRNDAREVVHREGLLTVGAGNAEAGREASGSNARHRGVHAIHEAERRLRVQRVAVGIHHDFVDVGHFTIRVASDVAGLILASEDGRRRRPVARQRTIHAVVVSPPGGGVDTYKAIQ